MQYLEIIVFVPNKRIFWSVPRRPLGRLITAYLRRWQFVDINARIINFVAALHLHSALFSNAPRSRRKVE